VPAKLFAIGPARGLAAAGSRHPLFYRLRRVSAFDLTGKQAQGRRREDLLHWGYVSILHLDAHGVVPYHV
jgi:hypothetical protein